MMRKAPALAGFLIVVFFSVMVTAQSVATVTAEVFVTVEAPPPPPPLDPIVVSNETHHAGSGTVPVQVYSERHELRAPMPVLVPSPVLVQIKVEDRPRVEKHPLRFGQVLCEGKGSVTVAPDGTPTARGRAKLKGGWVLAAAFHARGERNSTFAVSLPKTVELKSKDGKGKLQVTDFVYAPNKLRFDERGAQTFTVGATARLRRDQPPGDYDGSFTVEVRYANKR